MELGFAIEAPFRLRDEEIWVSLKIRVLSSGIICPKLWTWKISPWQVGRVVNKTRRRSSLLTTLATADPPWLIISIPSPLHSFIPTLKPSFSANPSHRSLPFSSSALTPLIPWTVYRYF